MSFNRIFATSSIENGTECKQETKIMFKLGTCHVCGDKASIINYGCLTCQSCKTFFRRNGFDPKNVRPCMFNNSCEVNIRTRRNCTHCRLWKCLLVGMNSDLIRKGIYSHKKYLSSSKLRMCKQIKSVQKLRLFNDQFLLVDSEQKLISKILYALNTYSTIPLVRHIIEDLFASPFDVLFGITDAFGIIIFIYTSMRSFINSTPDFQILTVNEQYSLFERNLNGIVNLYSVLVLRETNLLNNSDYLKSFTSIYGLKMMLHIRYISEQLGTDFTTLKLMLIVLAFSSNCSMVDVHENMFNDSLLCGTYHLLGSQNVYVEILWKYIVYQYGYYNSVLRFARLIEFLLNLIKYSAHVYMNNTTYRNLVEDFIKTTKQWLITNQNQQVSLWGKI